MGTQRPEKDRVEKADEPQAADLPLDKAPNVSTRLEKIAKLARENPKWVFTTLAHHIDLDFLFAAYLYTSKDAAPGIDGETATQYATDLTARLRSLLDRFKSGRYRAPAVRRVHIPKGDGKETRPIGIPTFEDKVLQRAVAMVLEAVYEPSFHPGSYGFRPGRSAHQAVQSLWEQAMAMRGGYVIEVDIKSYFDTIDHGHLRAILDQRVRDGVIRRMIDKWLNAGVMEGGNLFHPDQGTPQGGVISPLLANIYLDAVLDQWFEGMVKPVLRGRAYLIRYADDFVLGFEREDDARRVFAVLSKRFEKYGLKLHPTKTRQIDFRRPRDPKRGDPPESGVRPGSFDLLGFTWHWGKSRQGHWVIKRRTAKKRLARALHAISEFCRRHRHDEIAVQREKLGTRMLGHYNYYGVRTNYRSLNCYYQAVRRIWRFWLSRRSQRAALTWERFVRLIARYPLPKPRIRATPT